jgi:uncharacterized protein (TIGR02680 family)
MRALPVPAPGRWKPLRLGLVDLFHYDRQEFWFRDGRLMLRGNNGTGKSKVLALTLPFLLDGDTASHKVEPDGDPGKRMEWNLLLGGKYEDRLGYTWMEFGRVDETGREHFRTVGVALKALRGKGIADKWFFTTTRRVGAGLDLVAESGVVLSRDRLEAAIGTDGDVVRSAAHYRRLIDEQLFHLGEERYEALVDLLIQLRQPQLSKKPDEKKLSKALSQALAPVDQDVLADVAAAFHDQATQREALDGLKASARAASRFGERYREYARTAARRAAAGVRLSQSKYEKLGSSVKQLGEQIAGAEAERDRLDGELDTLDGLIDQTDARMRQLESRNELADLEAAQKLAAATAGAAEREALRRDEAAARAEAAAEAAAEASEALAVQRERAETALSAATESAHAAAMEPAHRRVAAPLSNLDALPPRPAVDAARAASRSAADERDRQVRQMAAQCRVVEDTERRTVAAERELGRLEQCRDLASDALAEAEAALVRSREAHTAAWAAFRGDELGSVDVEEAGLAEWTGTLAGPHPAVQAAQAAYQAASRTLAAAAHAAEVRRDAARARSAAASDEHRSLAEGGLRRPESPRTRAADRTGRLGAPLWQVVDFHERVGAAERAGYEAALEASGLLDAWLTPEGRFLGPGVLDDFLIACEPEASSARDVLRPAVDPTDPQAAALDPEAIAAVLASVGIGRGRNWIAADGSWRLGPRRGSWAKPEAEFIGHAAREAAKARRLSELAAAVAEADADAERAEHDLERLTRRQDRLDTEFSSLPSDETLREAHRRSASTAGELRRHREAVAAQTGTLTTLRADLEAAQGERELLAADLALPADPERLAAVAAAIGGYRGAAAELWAALEALRASAETARRAEADAADAAARLLRAEAERKTAAGEAAVAQARLEQLQHSIGATVDQLLADLQAARIALGEYGIRRAAAREARAGAADTASRLRGRVEQVQTEQAETAAARAEAIGALRGFAATGLLALAVPAADVPDPGRDWAPDPTVHLARRVEAELADTPADEETWTKVEAATSRDYQAFTEALGPHGHRPDGALAHGCFVVTVAYGGRSLFPGELAALLADEVDYREQLLSAKERELLEEHLVNEVAHHLQERIDSADAQVAEINAELNERPTSTGMRLRLVWKPKSDGPEGLAGIRRLLLREDSAMWSPADQRRVSAFLHRQIQGEAEADPEGTWAEHLTSALDYRNWHAFKIERHQRGEWKDGIGPASAGERALTVSVPLFAAASSHYRSAHEHAPRMIMLDEAFAGVDDDSRAKCLGLLTNFDLDVAMTSEREWGFYASVPGIRTHQLVRTDDIDAVYVTVFEWDGTTRYRIEEPE